MGVHLLQGGSRYFIQTLKYLDQGVQILRSIWTGGNDLGGSIFFVTGHGGVAPLDLLQISCSMGWFSVHACKATRP